MGLKPSGVCTKEHNLLKAMLAYRAPECPFSVKEETPREKLVEILEGLVIVEAYGVYLSKREIYGQIADQLIAHGVTVKEPQKPLKRGQLENKGFFFLERKEEEEVYPVVLKEGWEVYYVDFVGTDSLVQHDKADYGKTWRCWAEKPTEEERKAAEWES
jgi:hypothetical protein